MNPDTNPLNPFGAPTGIQTPVQAPQPAPQPTQPATQVASTVDPFVRQGQTFLSANGFNPGPIDGLMGPKTSAGIQAFQTSAGLPTTGQFDQATRNAIANFKPEPVPMPTISNEVDVTQLEAPVAPQIQIPERTDPFAIMRQSTKAASQTVINDLQTQLDGLRDKESDVTSQIFEALKMPGQVSAQQASLKESNVAKYQTELNDLLGRMKLEEANLQAQQFALEGEGAIRSTPGLARRQQDVEKQSLIRFNTLAAKASVLQGNIKLAQDMAEMAGKAAAEDRSVELERLGIMYDQARRAADAVGDEINAQKAAALQFQNDLAIEELNNQINQYNQGIAYATEALGRNADPKAVADFFDFAIKNPLQAPQEAIARFGQDLQNPTPQEALDMENARLQNVKLLQDISYGKLKEMELSQDILSMGKGLENNPLQQAIVAESIVSTEKLLDDPKLPVAVGIVRPIVKGVKYRDFVNSVESLIENLTLEKLGSAKETGVTFGALSEGEIGLVAAAATRIGLARDRGRDGKGEVKGYNMSEQAFREEVDTINNFRKLDAVLKGVPMETVGVVQTPDGALWTSNSYGQMVQLR